MITQQRQIDLHLPTSWNHCTTDELEIIAAAIIQEQQRVDRYHPFDWQRVKLSVVLAVNGLHVVSSGSATDDDSDSTFIVNRSEEEGNFPITTGQLLALTDMLAWVDDEKADRLIFQFPYPTMDVSGKTADHGKGVTVQGPPPLLDGYTWQEYRWMTDWMQEYMRLSNALLQVKSKEQRVKSREAAENARNEFLAVLFKPAGKPTDVSDKTADHSDSGSKFFNLHSSLFTSFDPVKWQVILFWWSSLMSILAKKFPKVFKQQPVGKGKRRPQQQDTPWDFYNRVTATIQKYIGGLSEQDVNNATYGTILQQLEMMADEAAEMEKLKHK